MVDVEIEGRAGQELDAALSSVEAVVDALARASTAVQPRLIPVALATGAIAAVDVEAPHTIPSQDIALIDGCALASSDLIGASPMSPAFVSGEPARVEVGDALPAGCDCVIEAGLVAGANGVFEIHAQAAPGEGVRRAGEDWKAGEVIVRSGARVTLRDAFLLDAAGLESIEARRPRILIAEGASRPGPRQTLNLIAALARDEGAEVEFDHAQGGAEFARALARDDWDAMFVVGGSGLGAHDRSVAMLRRAGDVVAHGLALDPGRTGAAALIRGKPAICIPGRFDSALAVYLALAAPMLRRLSAGPLLRAREAPLARKIASTVGLAQIVLLEAHGDAWAPLAVGDLTLAHLMRASAYLIIPEGSEGLAEGSAVAALRLPGRS